MLESKGKKRGLDRVAVVQIGEPVRETSPHYEAALRFRRALEKLGLQQGPVVRELVTVATPALEKIATSHAFGEGATMEVVVSLRVTRADGTRETFDVAKTPAPTRRRRARK